MDDDAKRAIALFRLGVLGPLVSARLEHGDRTAYFVEAASRRHVMPPDGRVVRLSARTIEAWYYLHKHGEFEALIPDARADKGRSRDSCRGRRGHRARQTVKPARSAVEPAAARDEPGEQRRERSGEPRRVDPPGALDPECDHVMTGQHVNGGLRAIFGAVL